MEPGDTSIHYGNATYYGTYYREHFRSDGIQTKHQRVRASLDNNVSFWLTRPSLLNLLTHVGFSSIHECLNPPFKGTNDRCTFIAIKGKPVELQKFPKSTVQVSYWEEGDLSYSNKAKIKKWLKWHIEDWLDRMGVLKQVQKFLSNL